MSIVCFEIGSDLEEATLDPRSSSFWRIISKSASVIDKDQLCSGPRHCRPLRPTPTGSLRTSVRQTSLGSWILGSCLSFERSCIFPSRLSPINLHVGFLAHEPRPSSWRARCRDGVTATAAQTNRRWRVLSCLAPSCLSATRLSLLGFWVSQPVLSHNLQE